MRDEPRTRAKAGQATEPTGLARHVDRSVERVAHAQNGPLLARWVSEAPAGAQRQGARPGGQGYRKSELSPARQRLVEILQKVGFGRIEMLVVRNGEPVFDPPPRIVRTIDLRKPAPADEVRIGADFQLKQQVIALLDQFERAPLLVVEEIRVQDGLPVQMTVVDEPRAW